MYNILDNVINIFYICLGHKCFKRIFIVVNNITLLFIESRNLFLQKKFGVHKCKYNVVYNVL